MMGYTHAVMGAAGAVTLAILGGKGTPEQYFLATIVGTIGGIAADFDVKDNFENPKVTEAIRTKIATLGLLVLGVILDIVFNMGSFANNVSRQSFALFGAISFCFLLLIGFFTKHRTFTHSLLFYILTSICVYLIYPNAVVYYSVGYFLHIVLDVLNFKVHGHGIWLLFPIKIGKGIALGLCKSGRTGNKVLYFVGLSGFIVSSVVYFWVMNDVKSIIVSSILLVYIPLVLHFVRIKSEKEQRHIMHINGEI